MTRDETRALVVDLVAALGEGWKTEEPDDNRLWLERQLTDGRVTLWLLPPGSYEVPEDELEIRLRLEGDKLAAHRVAEKPPPVFWRFSVKLPVKRIAGLLKKHLAKVAPYLETLESKGPEILQAEESVRAVVRRLADEGILWMPLAPGEDPGFRKGEWRGVKFGADVALADNRIVVVVRGLDEDDACALLRILKQGDENARARMNPPTAALDS